jgi:hypothetical protein
MGAVWYKQSTSTYATGKNGQSLDLLSDLMHIFDQFV